MSDEALPPTPGEAPADPARSGTGDGEAGAQQTVAFAADKPAPHGTPHEVEGSPVRNPADLEGRHRPGTTNEATRQLPP